VNYLNKFRLSRAGFLVLGFAAGCALDDRPPPLNSAITMQREPEAPVGVPVSNDEQKVGNAQLQGVGAPAVSGPAPTSSVGNTATGTGAATAPSGTVTGTGSSSITPVTPDNANETAGSFTSPTAVGGVAPPTPTIPSLSFTNNLFSTSGPVGMQTNSFIPRPGAIPNPTLLFTNNFRTP